MPTPWSSGTVELVARELERLHRDGLVLVRERDGLAAAQVKAGTSGRTVTFTAADGAFDGLPGVTATERLGDRVVLTTGDVEATLLALLAGGRRLPDLDVRGASLEEAVLSLTSRSRAPIGADR